MMVVADGSGAFAAAAAASAPLHYGGITKEAWVLSDGALQPVPFFWVASVAGGAAPVGVTTFTGEAGEAALGLLEQAPGPVSAVGLFPCFTRGVNKYDAEDVETAAIAQVVGASRRTCTACSRTASSAPRASRASTAPRPREGPCLRGSTR